MSDRKAPALWNREIVSRASIESFTKLDPRKMIRNPVMFVVEVTSVLVMFTLIRDTLAHKMVLAGFEFQIALWLWSPCCSRTLPKRWRKAAARRRPTICARRAPRRRPS